MIIFATEDMVTIIKEKKLIMTEISRLISEGKSVSITAKGYSMNPFIRHMEDQITIGPWTDKEIKAGTVVLVKDNYGNFLIHRIIKREGKNLFLMGDGNIGLTEKATTDNIIGVLKSVTKNGRIHPADGLIWKSYSLIWRLLTPVRRYPLALWRRLHPQQPLR